MHGRVHTRNRASRRTCLSTAACRKSGPPGHSSKSSSSISLNTVVVPAAAAACWSLPAALRMAASAAPDVGRRAARAAVEHRVPSSSSAMPSRMPLGLAMATGDRALLLGFGDQMIVLVSASTCRRTLVELRMEKSRVTCDAVSLIVPERSTNHLPRWPLPGDEVPGRHVHEWHRSVSGCGPVTGAVTRAIRAPSDSRSPLSSSMQSQLRAPSSARGISFRSSAARRSVVAMAGFRHVVLLRWTAEATPAFVQQVGRGVCGEGCASKVHGMWPAPACAW